MRKTEASDMAYRIISGRYETGSEEAKAGYRALFGEEDIQYRFDLYFHWYNIVHEAGHILVEQQKKIMSGVEEEMYVNRFAVAYYRFIGEDKRLAELKKMLEGILASMPPVVPEGESFEGFYESIWNTEQINNVMIYGYFQLRSVMEALRKDCSLELVLGEIGVEIDKGADLSICDAEICSGNTGMHLEKFFSNMRKLGVSLPEIKLELTDDPMVQCARPE